MRTKLGLFYLVAIFSSIIFPLFYCIYFDSNPITNVRRLKFELLRTWQELSLLEEKGDTLRLEVFRMMEGICRAGEHNSDENAENEKLVDESRHENTA